MQGDLDRVELSIQLLTGKKLENGRLIDVPEPDRGEMSRRLRQLGGPTVAARFGS